MTARAGRVVGSRPPSSRTKAPTARPSSAGRPSASPFQNGSRPGCPGAGVTSDPVVGDLLDPPGRRAEREHVADPGLVDHLLVELADAATGPSRPTQEHPEQPAVGDRAAAGHREPLRAGPAVSVAGDAVPDDARAQLGELVARVAAGEHVERRRRRPLAAASANGAARARPSRAGRRRARRRRDGIATTCWASTSRGLRGTRSASICAVAHALGDDRRLHEVAAVLREDHAAC